MTQEQKLAALTRWQQAMEQADAALNPVISLLKLEPESPVCEAVWRLQRVLIDTTADLVGDQGDWLDWYAHENEMGRKGYEAGPPWQQREIRTLEDLLWILGSHAQDSAGGSAA